jgi:hypothetical protein
MEVVPIGEIALVRKTNSMSAPKNTSRVALFLLQNPQRGTKESGVRLPPSMHADNPGSVPMGFLLLAILAAPLPLMLAFVSWNLFTAPRHAPEPRPVHYGLPRHHGRASH